MPQGCPSRVARIQVRFSTRGYDAGLHCRAMMSGLTRGAETSTGSWALARLTHLWLFCSSLGGDMLCLHVPAGTFARLAELPLKFRHGQLPLQATAPRQQRSLQICSRPVHIAQVLGCSMC